MKKLPMKPVFLFILVIPFFACAQSGKNKKGSTGPEKGSLVIVGGGASDAIIKRFVDLAGGNSAEIVVVPTAAGNNTYGDNASGADKMRAFGAKKVTVLHTADKSIANSDAFNTPLSTATGVWFGGGRQWRLVDAYKDTRAEQMFWQVLERGGVIGGSSAGATIQGSYLARGDTRNNQIMTGDHEEGFGFIKNIAIDQHVLARNRHFDMFEILRKYPNLLGISIDERTAIVVKGNRFEVIGDHYVIIYDGKFWSKEGWGRKRLPDSNRLFYFLSPGDKYNLKKRKVMEQ
ncbi:cyanophycinase [Fulvivirgaceae bacterium BMA12]|uniref:Cyanophycinase n=1 Tax=Agaribacillus aureus TaxID=3051825 RepID=A0ABT8L3H8_9BACT|nr:cyanophycinase [Fulvivirgaceae bacterium BMA12]